MRKIIFGLIMLVVLVAAPVHGGPAGRGHDHSAELSQSQILAKASAFVAMIAGAGKLEDSWIGVKPQEAQKDKRRHQWVVTFFNPEVKNLEKQTLYMFLDLSGNYIAANFTGR
ncbi:MAG: hypothetical protein EYX74_05315 [Desulfobulbaceae bacterium]|nr:MAG: hypothetical protein EYX74_05315 [Desulfobulbaceae bacterium]